MKNKTSKDLFAHGSDFQYVHVYRVSSALSMK